MLWRRVRAMVAMSALSYIKLFSSFVLFPCEHICFVLTETGLGSPRLSKRGRNGPTLSGGLGGGGCMQHSLLVAIAIVAMDGSAIAITDPGLASAFGPQIEGAAGADQHPPHMRARPRSLGHYRSHQVARLVAEMHLVPLPVADREAIFIDAAHLPVAMAGGFDQQRNHLARL